MIILPLIVLGIWAISIYKRNGLTFGLAVVGLYFITAIGSVLMDVNDFYTFSCVKQDLGIFAPLLYCILLSFCLYPYTKIGKLNFKNTDKLNGLTLLLIIYLSIFFVILAVSFTRINEILLYSNLAEVRNDLYIGESVSFYDHLSGLKRYICAICATLAPSSYIMSFFFVYSIAFLKNKWWYNAALLISSLSPILISINVADRSQIVYCFIVFVASVILFRKCMSAKAVRAIGVAGLLFGGVLLVYFMMVTVSRFADRSSGTNGGLVAYLGQNYINFCNYVNYVTPGFQLSQLFPVTDKYLIHSKPIPPQTSIGGFELNGFTTFLGAIYFSFGAIGMLLYSVCYRIVSTKFVNKLRIQTITQLDTLIICWELSLVVLLGVFGHFYSTENSIYAFVVWILIGKYLKRKNK